MTIEERLEPYSSGLEPDELARYEEESKLFDSFALSVKEGSSYCKPNNLYNSIVLWIKRAGYAMTKIDKPRNRLKKLGVIMDDTEKRLEQEPLKTPLALAMFSLMDQVEGRKSSSLTINVDELQVSFDGDGDLQRSCAYEFLIAVQTELDVWFNISLIRLDASKLSVSAKDNPSPPMRKLTGII